jgi:hypothetical protein
MTGASAPTPKRHRRQKRVARVKARRHAVERVHRRYGATLSAAGALPRCRARFPRRPSVGERCPFRLWPCYVSSVRLIGRVTVTRQASRTAPTSQTARGAARGQSRHARWNAGIGVCPAPSPGASR